jgi:hypothetical protein
MAFIVESVVEHGVPVSTRLGASLAPTILMPVGEVSLCGARWAPNSGNGH